VRRTESHAGGEETRFAEVSVGLIGLVRACATISSFFRLPFSTSVTFAREHASCSAAVAADQQRRAMKFFALRIIHHRHAEVYARAKPDPPNPVVFPPREAGLFITGLKERARPARSMRGPSTAPPSAPQARASKKRGRYSPAPEAGRRV